MHSRWYLAALVLLFAAYGALYARTVHYEHVWRDVPGLTENPIYEGPWLAGLSASQEGYGPVAYLSHRLDRELYGESPAGHHAHSVVLGALALALVLTLARRWLRDDRKALAVAAVFALHPLQVESIAYVSARGDLLAALFALAALALALRGADQSARRWPWVLLSSAAWLLSLLSSDTYIGLPLALLLIGWSMGRPRAHLVDVCAHGVALAVYLALRSSSVPPTGGHADLAAMLVLPGLWLQYFSIALVPSDLSIVRPLTALWIVPGWLAVLVISLGIGFASRAALGIKTRLMRVALAGASLALVLIGPSAMLAKATGVVADRHACLPLVGYAVAVISAGHWLAVVAPAALRPLHLLAAGLASAFLIATALQIPVWVDAKMLYLNALMIERSSSDAAYGLGLAHVREGNWSFALPYFVQAVDLDPQNAKAWNNIAAGALQQGDYGRAIVAAKRAAAATSSPFRSLHNLAIAHLMLGETREGCDALARALEHDPSSRDVRDQITVHCGAQSPK